MEHLLKISEFSILSGIKRKNLIYYDEIGLLSPEHIMENGYRLYSHRQLEIVSVICALQEVGMPLREIKRHLDNRTPDALIALFSAQRTLVEQKIQSLQHIEAMIDTRLGMTRRALEVDLEKIELRSCAQELLFAGDEFECENTGEQLDEAMVAFYELCEEKKITYGYPLSTMVSQENLLNKKFRCPSRFFFKMPTEEGNRAKWVKPKGLYLIGFERTSYEGAQKLYERMFAYAKQQSLAIIGNAYEEFLLDEIAVKTPDTYLLQISIQVEQL